VRRPLAVLLVHLSDRDGGAERQTAALGAGLLARGHRVLTLARHGTAAGRRALEAGSPVFPLQPGFPRGPAGLLTRWSSRRVRDLSARGRWDLVHFADPGSCEACRRLLGAGDGSAFPRSRVLVTWRGCAGRAPVPSSLRSHHRAGGMIHAASEALWAALVREGLEESRLSVIHPGISVDRFAADPGTRPAIRGELGLEDLDEVIGTVAVLDRDRRIGDLLEAVRDHLADRPRVRALIVGDGRGRASLERMAGAGGLSGRVSFTGWREEIHEVLRAFDVYVFTGSGREIFPLSLVEAMAAGVPVVAADQPGIREILENGKQGLLVPGARPRDLARTIRRLLENRDEAARMGRAGAVRVQRFTTRAMVDDTEKLYYRLLREGAAP
jgi:glycosyltransferase involved in cell wall biosynthesis